MRSYHFALLAVLLCTSAASLAFAAASLTPLRDLPGGTFLSVTQAVSADGSTAVGYGSFAFFRHGEWRVCAGPCEGGAVSASVCSLKRRISLLFHM